MDASRLVRTRLGATRLLLQGLDAATAKHKTSSNIQRAAVIEMLRSGSFTVTERSELLSLVQDISWADGDEDLVLAELGRDTAHQPAPDRGRWGNDFLSIESF